MSIFPNIEKAEEIGGPTYAPSLSLIVLLCLLVTSTPSGGQTQRVAAVNASRILNESALAKQAQTRIDIQFAQRKLEIDALADIVTQRMKELDRDEPKLADSQRVRRRAEVAIKQRDLEKKRIAFREDRRAVRREDAQTILDLTTKIVIKVASDRRFDMVVQEAVFVNPANDITDEVISVMNAETHP